ADVARGAAAVLHHHLLAEQLRHARLQDAADEVGGAAGRERHDHAQRPVGIALCSNPGGEEDENTEKNPLHVSSDSMGSEIARLSRADLSKALLSISRLCASAAV